MAQGIISRHYSLGSGNSLNNILDGSQPGSVRTSGSTEESDSYTIGQYAFAEGENTKASGNASHAEGYYTTAGKAFSHAEGRETTASGLYSHAEGWNTIASGECSHAEGYSTEARGSYSHAEGYATTASGNNSHAEGWDTTASGGYSHAEGSRTAASGQASHAEGIGTAASRQASHAEGDSATANGQASHAEGLGTTADGYYSHSEGNSTTADGEASHAEGYQTTALKYCSHVEGYSSNSMPSSISITTSSNTSLSGTEKTNITDTWNSTEFSLAGGLCSHAEGRDCLALGDHSHAEGRDCLALGSHSHAEGYRTEASGARSHAEGANTTASGVDSHAEGQYTTASGQASHASGYYTTANDYQTTIGKYNKVSDGPTGVSDTTGDIFIIGGGTASSPSSVSRINALRTTTAGKTYGLSAFSSSGADYAEYFEWLDGNPDNEDRRGLFVTLDGEKIRIASSDDDFILGVVSSTPAFDGDSQSEIWHSMYLTDVFGEKLTETIEVPETTDEETGIVTPAHIETRWILNPDYDPEKSYEGREKRKEWTPVGLIGKLVVIDDGTCEVNGYCKVGENGKATKSEEKTSYRVMRRIDENHVRILIK